MPFIKNILNIKKWNVFELFDYVMLLCVLSLVTIGIAFIYSSGINSQGLLVTNEHIKQIVWASLGLVIMILMVLYDYRRLERKSRVLYIIFLVLLLYTRIFGRYVNGAKSWIGIGDFGVQPSEFMKIVLILFLAAYLNSSKKENQMKRFLIAMGIFLLPTGLVLIQPDMGTASVYIPIFLVMCFIAEIPFHYIFYVFLLGILTIAFTVLPIWNDKFMSGSVSAINVLTNIKLRIVVLIACVTVALIAAIVRRYFHGRKYFFWISYFFSIISLSLVFSIAGGKVLHDYQIQRLIIFINPAVDPQGAGWNIIQSKTAIGAGGIWGRSFLQGTQSHYRFLPQQSTDFIFSILSEEWGFMGGVLVFALYAVILYRILFSVMSKTSSRYGLYVASGILAMMFYHFILNVGMVMGVMPITGVPLLFLSYGGSALWTAMAGVGILMSIGGRKNDFLSLT